MRENENARMKFEIELDFRGYFSQTGGSDPTLSLRTVFLLVQIYLTSLKSVITFFNGIVVSLKKFICFILIEIFSAMNAKVGYSSYSPNSPLGLFVGTKGREDRGMERFLKRKCKSQLGTLFLRHN